MQYFKKKKKVKRYIRNIASFVMIKKKTHTHTNTNTHTHTNVKRKKKKIKN